METNLPTPMTARVYVNLPEGKSDVKPTTMIIGYRRDKG
jgi:hypothetical protein